MINIQFITVDGCQQCAKAKQILEELKPQHPKMQVEEIDATTEQGMELVSKYGIFQSPGIIINSELFSTGGLDKDKFIAKLKELE